MKICDAFNGPLFVIVFMLSSECLAAEPNVSIIEVVKEVAIEVVDENSQGVKSIVWLHKTLKDQIRFGKTGDKGHLKKKHSCELGQVLYAEPEDRGTYFNSEEADCSDNVVLHVIHRQIPRRSGAYNDTSLNVATNIVRRSAILRGADGSEQTYKIIGRARPIGGTVYHATRSFNSPFARCDRDLYIEYSVDVYEIEDNGIWLEVESTQSMSSISYTGRVDCAEEERDSKAITEELSIQVDRIESSIGSGIIE